VKSKGDVVFLRGMTSHVSIPESSSEVLIIVLEFRGWYDSDD
jgi:hypothetical protein